MAKYGKVGRFLKEDFEGAPMWFVRFLEQLNRFKDQVEDIIDRKIAVNDNVDGEIKDLDITADSFPVDFKSARGKPRVVAVGGCVDTTSGETPAPHPRIAWKYEGGQIIITGVGTGDLTAGRKYRLTLLILIN